MKIRKVCAEHRDAHQLSARLTAETPYRWDFRPIGQSFHHVMDGAFIGDLWIGHISTRTGYDLDRPGITAARLEIHFVETGACEITSDYGTTKVRAGQVHIACAKRCYKVRNVPGSKMLVIGAPVARYTRLISAGTIDPMEAILSLQPVLPYEHPVVEALRGIALLLLAPEQDVIPYATFSDSISPLKEALFRVLMSGWPRQRAEKQSTYHSESHPLKLAQEWVQSHLADKIAVKDMALAAGLSSRGLQALFKREIGTSPIQYVIMTRMQAAHLDLLDPDNTETIAAILMRHGLHFPSDFEQRYKEFYGQTPSDTRRLARLRSNS